MAERDGEEVEGENEKGRVETTEGVSWQRRAEQRGRDRWGQARAEKKEQKRLNPMRQIQLACRRKE